jgi:hypothetical protein
MADMVVCASCNDKPINNNTIVLHSYTQSSRQTIPLSGDQGPKLAGKIVPVSLGTVPVMLG